jgi:hypothetical protein
MQRNRSGGDALVHRGRERRCFRASPCHCLVCLQHVQAKAHPTISSPRTAGLRRAGAIHHRSAASTTARGTRHQRRRRRRSLDGARAALAALSTPRPAASRPLPGPSASALGAGETGGLAAQLRLSSGSKANNKCDTSPPALAVTSAGSPLCALRLVGRRGARRRPTPRLPGRLRLLKARAPVRSLLLHRTRTRRSRHRQRPKKKRRSRSEPQRGHRAFCFASLLRVHIVA